MRLFIGNLSFQTGEHQIEELFSRFGLSVENVKVVRDFNTGRSRGFAFADVPNEAEGRKAIQTLNNYELDNRKLVVNEARAREARPAGGPRGGRSGDRGRSRPRW